MVSRLFALIVYVYAGTPVISSKDSSGDNPRAYVYPPIILTQAFSRIKGHS